jgi:hypothetical protein
MVLHKERTPFIRNPQTPIFRNIRWLLRILGTDQPGSAPFIRNEMLKMPILPEIKALRIFGGFLQTKNP